MKKKTKITRDNLLIYKPERLTNTPDGGGLMTGEVFTGAKNEAFAPVDKMKALNGGLDIVKMYPAVLRADDEPVYGANFIIALPPQTPSWSFVAFKALNDIEERASAAARLATYIIKTVRSRMTLYATQSKDSRVVQVYQNVKAPLPKIGEVYCLEQGILEQYIRIESLTDEVVSFYDNDNGIFYKRVITIVTVNKLKHAFVGVNYPSRGKADSPCLVLQTHVTDSAYFFGVKRAVANAKALEHSVQVESLYEKIIPTNSIETPLPNQSISGESTGFLDAAKSGGAGIITYATEQVLRPGSALYTGSAITPNSLRILCNGVTFTDNNKQLLADGKPVGTVNYGQGQIVLSGDAPTYHGRKSISFRPAGATTAASDTAMIPVTTANRRKSYVKTINPSPSAGSLRVSYCAQGKWYTLTDNGAGKLSGTSEEHGTGNFIFATDTLVLELQTPPDANTAIIISWATSGNQFNRADEITLHPEILLTLPHLPARGTLTLTHPDGTSTDDGTGTVSGDGVTGTLRLNKLHLALSTLPRRGAEYVFDYSAGVEADQHSETITPSGTSGSGEMTLSLQGSNLARGSVRVSTQVSAGIKTYYPGEPPIARPGEFVFRAIPPTKTEMITRNVSFYDDGAGNIVTSAGDKVGTVDYAAGSIVIKPEAQLGVFVSDYKLRARYKTRKFRHTGADLSISYATGTATAKSATLVLDELTVDITPRYAEYIVAGSVVFTLGGRTYYDRVGKLYHSLNPATGQGVPAGTINYQTGVVKITSWQDGQPADIVLKALLTSTTVKGTNEVTFRVPVTPISVVDFQFLGTTTLGERIDITATPAGELIGDKVRGRIDAKTGIGTVQFGEMVDAAGLESEPWYDANDVVGGKIWQPAYVYPDTLTYNATAYTSVPMDDTGLGVDTARLPSNGEVPIFRAGDTVTIASRWQQTLSTALSAGQSIQLNQTDLTVLCLLDSNNKHVDAELYDINLQTGVLTILETISPADYQLPLIARYAYEEDNVVTDTDIDGTLTLRFALKRSFDKLNCFVSSVLRASGTGNLRVRATKPFAQRTWPNVWSDAPNAAPVLAKLDTRNYPIKLTDDGAMTERWLIKFTNTSQFELYGETLGLITKGDIWEDLAPLNPATGKPFFTIDANAFSNNGVSAWANGYCIRFNTFGTAMPVWLIRAVQPSSDPQVDDDGYAVMFRADTVEAED